MCQFVHASLCACVGVYINTALQHKQHCRFFSFYQLFLRGNNIRLLKLNWLLKYQLILLDYQALFHTLINSLPIVSQITCSHKLYECCTKTLHLKGHHLSFTHVVYINQTQMQAKFVRKECSQAAITLMSSYISQRARAFVSI